MRLSATALRSNKVKSPNARKQHVGAYQNLKIANMKLPSNYHRAAENNLIKNAPLGVTVYAVSWAIWTDMEGEIYVNEGFTYEYRPIGTCKMPIIRTKKGYFVTPSEDRLLPPRETPPYNNDDTTDCYGPTLGFCHEYKPEKRDLKAELTEALKSEDYERAARLQKEIAK